MSVVENFMERYRKEYDFYLEAARLCRQKCDTELEQNGIRAIVTYRAKNPDRLKNKVASRNEQKPYTRVAQIYNDIIDLAGVRIALYFPGDAEEVERIIYALFDVKKKKEFPRDGGPRAYSTRFSGYAARHYRVQLRQADLDQAAVRYADAPIEIQVASVLIHAWSEVEHDLVYKPLSGRLSEDEYAILDELNGLVLTGEIALERLQRAQELRLRFNQGNFSNHYELAHYIYERVSKAK
jgi:ppGpp synthetase/RelA/SpoT-type nucleotidyltranferase